MPKDNHNINPSYKKSPFKTYTIEECFQGVKSRNSAIVSYLISNAESHLPKDQKMVAEVSATLQDTGHSRVIAVSGSPGVGKSTFINSIAHHLSNQNHTVAVLPVDPSSAISRGSILGDKTRMEDIVSSDKVYIKPMPSSLSIGGVAPASYLATYICKLAAFDYIFIETVGVGQSEYEARHMADLFLLLLQPGGGDDLQGIKRGIMEMADMLIIHKADGAHLQNAQMSLQAYNQALKLILPNAYNWKASSALYSSVTHEQSQDMEKLIDEYYNYMNDQGRLSSLRKQQRIDYFDRHYRSVILRKINTSSKLTNAIDQLRSQIESDTITPFAALQEIESIVE